MAVPITLESQWYLYHYQTTDIWCAAIYAQSDGSRQLYVTWRLSDEGVFNSYEQSYSDPLEAVAALFRLVDKQRERGFFVLLSEAYDADTAQKFDFPNLEARINREPETRLISENLVPCPTCGTLNRDTAAYCRSCRTSLMTNLPPTRMLTVGNTLASRYRIDKMIGQGGFGTVYLGADLRLNSKVVAIKEVRVDGNLPQLQQQQVVRGFEQEMQLLAGLGHPSLPDIYDFWITPVAGYLVMEYIDGQTLQEDLDGGVLFSEADACALGLSLCDVLEYLHSHQPPIIFRDLKPANVMLRSSGGIALIDFGIARLFKVGQTRDTIAMGSPGYASPEQHGNAQTTPRSDIYSLGATLSYVLTGRDPGDSPFIFPPFQKSLSISKELERLVHQMVEIKVEKRPQNVAEVARRLREITHGQHVSPRPAPFRTREVKATIVSETLLGSFGAYGDQALRFEFKDRLSLMLSDTYSFLFASEPEIGEDVVQYCESSIASADIIFVLVTASLWKNEYAPWLLGLANARAGQVPVIPILLEPVRFWARMLDERLALPHSKIPLDHALDRESDYGDVIAQCATILRALRKKK